MIKDQKVLEDIIKSVRPQMEQLLWESRALGAEDAIIMWIQKNHVEFTANCADGTELKIVFNIKDGKLYRETTIFKKEEVAENDGYVG